MENAPASVLAVRLGEALHRTTRAGRGLEQIALTLHADDVTLPQLTALLETTAGVRLFESNGVLELQPPGGGTRWAPDLETPRLEMFFAIPDVPADHLARLFCGLAGPHRSAFTAGDAVVVYGTSSERSMFGALWKSLRDRSAADRHHPEPN